VALSKRKRPVRLIEALLTGVFGPVLVLESQPARSAETDRASATKVLDFMICSFVTLSGLPELHWFLPVGRKPDRSKGTVQSKIQKVNTFMRHLIETVSH
jgi:hypothetical protein